MFGTPWAQSKKNPDQKYYRLYFYPVLPAARYSLRDGKLQFSYTYNGYATDGQIAVEHRITDHFNIQGMLGNSYAEFLIQAQARETNIPNKDSPVMVLDFATDKLESANKDNRDYSKTELEDLFVQPAPVIYGNGRYNFKTDNYLKSPIYYRVNRITASGFGGEAGQVISQTGFNPLKGDNGLMNIINYEMSDPAVGKDIQLNPNARLREVAYKKTYKDDLKSWSSHLQEKVNKDSYHRLTGDTDLITAANVAKLFEDYAVKGSGFSSLIHFHLFRHTQNIGAAKEIARMLTAPEYSNASPQQIAELLVERFKQLVAKGNTINPDGSFARRINFALLQLTQGLCQTVKDYDNFKDSLQEASLNHRH